MSCAVFHFVGYVAFAQCFYVLVASIYCVATLFYLGATPKANTSGISS